VDEKLLRIGRCTEALQIIEKTAVYDIVNSDLPFVDTLKTTKFETAWSTLRGQ